MFKNVGRFYTPPKCYFSVTSLKNPLGRIFINKCKKDLPKVLHTKTFLGNQRWFFYDIVSESLGISLESPLGNPV